LVGAAGRKWSASWTREAGSPSGGSGGVESRGGQHSIERGRQAVAGGAGEERGGHVRRERRRRVGPRRVDRRRQEERRRRRRTAVAADELLTLTPLGATVLEPHLDAAKHSRVTRV